VSQGDRTRAVVALIEKVAREDDDRPVVLVGHSLGGLTVSAVVEAIPERVCAVVYLAAFLLPAFGGQRVLIVPSQQPGIFDLDSGTSASQPSILTISAMIDMPRPFHAVLDVLDFMGK
jgi:pimeloyl-ACP methyl ester carboxylesterase